jgi:hypothetical protein
MSKDRDRQGPGNVGAGNKSADKGGKSAGPAAAKGASAGPAAAKGASAASAAKDKSAAAAPAKDKGGLGGFFGGLFGGNKGPSGPTAADRPRARPDVVKTGAGKDMRYMDTRTGKSFAAPEYGAFSFRGLTSNDPANVARNRYGREGLDAMRAGMGDRGADRSGIASLQAPSPQAPSPQAPSPQPAPAPVDLTQIGMPTTEMAPIFVAPPVYGAPAPQIGPGYGAVFAGAPVAPQFSMMDLIDLFGPTMNFGR